MTKDHDRKSILGVRVGGDRCYLQRALVKSIVRRLFRSGQILDTKSVHGPRCALGERDVIDAA